MTSQEKFYQIEELPYEELWHLIGVAHYAGEEADYVDADFNLAEAAELYRKALPIKDEREDARAILNCICLGHNAPDELKEKLK